MLLLDALLARGLVTLIRHADRRCRLCVQLRLSVILRVSLLQGLAVSSAGESRRLGCSCTDGGVWPGSCRCWRLMWLLLDWALSGIARAVSVRLCVLRCCFLAVALLSSLSPVTALCASACS